MKRPHLGVLDAADRESERRTAQSRAPRAFAIHEAVMHALAHDVGDPVLRHHLENVAICGPSPLEFPAEIEELIRGWLKDAEREQERSTT